MVYELLQHGRENATRGRDLCDQLGGINLRELGSRISDERRDGRPIAASMDARNPGFYIPRTRAEMNQYCRVLEHREKELGKTRRACLKAGRTLPD